MRRNSLFDAGIARRNDAEGVVEKLVVDANGEQLGKERAGLAFVELSRWRRCQCSAMGYCIGTRGKSRFEARKGSYVGIKVLTL